MTTSLVVHTENNQKLPKRPETYRKLIENSRRKFVSEHRIYLPNISVRRPTVSNLLCET